MTTVSDALPPSIRAVVPMARWTHDVGVVTHTEDTLTLVSGRRTDWTRDARLVDEPQMRSTALVFPVDGDIVVDARVSVTGERTTFDAGVLAIWADDAHWAKLCFEMSPAGEAMVVSVVTNDFADDANSAVVHGDAVWLRIARLGGAYLFQSSVDGVSWRFVRLFRLVSDAPVYIGFMAQSPNGDECTAHFSDISIAHRTLDELRETTAQV